MVGAALRRVTMNPNLAYVCASLSRRVYDDAPDLAGLGHRLLGRYDRGGTQAFLSTDGVRVFLAFRGTEPERSEDLITDLRYVKTDFPGGGRVHKGFLRAFTWVEHYIEDALEELNQPLIFTGHSLGAALALLAAAMWRPRAVYLFGCPRAGNRAFVKRIACPVHRFENRGDLVTHIPPPTSLLQAVYSLAHFRWPTLYRHAGRRIRLSGLGHGSDAYERAAARRTDR